MSQFLLVMFGPTHRGFLSEEEPEDDGALGRQLGRPDGAVMCGTHLFLPNASHEKAGPYSRYKLRGESMQAYGRTSENTRGHSVP